MQSRIDRDIYLRLPEGLGVLYGNVAQLDKTLYGLRQSPKILNQLLVLELSESGPEICKADPCSFRRGKNDDELIVGVYVDDLIQIGETQL